MKNTAQHNKCILRKIYPAYCKIDPDSPYVSEGELLIECNGIPKPFCIFDPNFMNYSSILKIDKKYEIKLTSFGNIKRSPKKETNVEFIKDKKGRDWISKASGKIISIINESIIVDVGIFINAHDQSNETLKVGDFVILNGVDQGKLVMNLDESTEKKETKFVKVKVFKGKEEKTAEIYITCPNKCKFNDKLISSGDKTSDYCRLLSLQEQMEGFKFKTCINCFFFNYLCKNNQCVGGKDYCMPRFFLVNKISDEMNTSKISPKKKTQLELQHKFLWGENSTEKQKRFMSPIDSCNNFLYADPEKKIEELKDMQKYKKKVEKLTGKEDRWYWKNNP
jgi:hypothetical protein